MNSLIRLILGPFATFATGVIFGIVFAGFVFGIKDKDTVNFFAIGGGILALLPQALRLVVWVVAFIRAAGK